MIGPRMDERFFLGCGWTNALCCANGVSIFNVS